MHRSYRVAIWVSAVVVLAVVCSEEAVGAKVSDDLQRSFILSESGSVSVKNINGSVRVDVADGDHVLLRARTIARDSDDLARIRIGIDESPERIEIETKIPRGLKGANVSYELRVPRRAHVQTSSVNGSIKINGIQGETRANSVNGSVRIGEASGNVTANTVNGSLEVVWNSLEGSSRNSLKTVNGALKIWMPHDAEGTIEAKTVNGSIKTDFHLEVRKARFGHQRSISDSIGENGPEFALSTVNGSIRILEN